MAKALGGFHKKMNGGNVEQDTQRMTVPEFKISIVRVKPQPRKHKVISYGYRVLANGEPPEMYRFQYLPDPTQPEDLYPGTVPAGFSAGVPVDDTMIYFHTREGTVGPEYQVVYSQPDPEGGDEPRFNLVMEWNDDVDAMWCMTLQKLEDNACMTEDAIAFLDADPLWLFGIAAPETQRALEKTAVVPMLRCMSQRPCIEEWFAYLNADEKADCEYKWVVESFMDVELPQPWVSFKGVGSVVCYLDNQTNETTWKHPFYDYFAQLLEHCRRSTHEEHVKLRINRVLWSYEAETQSDVQHQMPLVSPKYVNTLGQILAVDLEVEPYMVRTLKTFLKAFSQMYHEGELDTQEVKWCIEIVGNERTKFAVMKQMENEPDPSKELDDAKQGQILCVECKNDATCYCPECEDCLCEECRERLHRTGNRALHQHNNFIYCAMCKITPAKLQCTYTRGKYCGDCFTKKHQKTLPKFLDLKPLKIDYRRSKKDMGDGSLEPTMSAINPVLPEDQDSFSKAGPLETTLGEKWHAFYDLRGVKYYYNFESEESLRRPQAELMSAPQEADAEYMAQKNVVLGFLSKSRDPRLLEAWKEGCEPAEDPNVRKSRKSQR